jgi:hypothetical protein
MSEAGLDVPTIVIPYRDRRAHIDCVLARFRNFSVVVLEQCDSHPFNRGALLNAGYNKARDMGARRVILHDCDLVPDDTLLGMYREEWPRPIVHFGARFRRYNNSRSYFGGVHGFHAGEFPGYPNHFWGWGGEDDALRKRVDLQKTTYARHGEYLDLEGYATARDKLKHLPHSERCADKYEKLAQDDAKTDSHRVGAPSSTIVWDTDKNVTWGSIIYHRGA